MRYSFIIPFLFLFAACTSYEYEEHHSDFSNKVWKEGKELSFSPTIEDTSSSYKLFLDFRHVYGYPFETLEVKIRMVAPSGEEQTLEPSIKVLEKKEGEDPSYLSDCSGDICDLTVELENGLRFAEKGEHKFYVTQAMGREKLPNVMGLGIMLQKEQSAEEVIIEKEVTGN